MRHLFPLLVAAASLATSCSDSDPRPDATRPSPFGGLPSAVSVSATSPVATALQVSDPFCPSVTPFNVPLVVVVQPNDGVNFAVTSMRLQFFDTAGNAMPQVTLPAPVPTTQFGSALTEARSQTFPVTLGIGCGTGHIGTVRIVVDTRDDHGRSGSGRTTVSVR
jgi:hypothetical protein